MADELAQTEIRDLDSPFLSNTTGSSVDDRRTFAQKDTPIAILPTSDVSYRVESDA